MCIFFFHPPPLVSFKNVTFMMMGSADELPSAPPEPIKFLEDMSESEAAAVSECERERESFNMVGRNECTI